MAKKLSIQDKIREQADREKQKKDAEQKALLNEKEGGNPVSVVVSEPNVNNNNIEDINIDAIINQNRTTKSDKQMVGIYFDPDVKKALEKYQRKEGKGAKSSLLNDLARAAMKQKGFL
ncbi:hypothetical protein ACSU64_27835 [Bacillaceae bacterium C204]|uniref:hypothetical protein n=1 Tax=Neobacillus sp. 204 TaxID=3383351 RepID=UPI00397C1579